MRYSAQDIQDELVDEDELDYRIDFDEDDYAHVLDARCPHAKWLMEVLCWDCAEDERWEQRQENYMFYDEYSPRFDCDDEFETEESWPPPAPSVGFFLNPYRGENDANVDAKLRQIRRRQGTLRSHHRKERAASISIRTGRQSSRFSDKPERPKFVLEDNRWLAHGRKLTNPANYDRMWFAHLQAQTWRDYETEVVVDMFQRGLPIRGIKM
jgi:hypothetical protein